MATSQVKTTREFDIASLAEELAAATSAEIEVRRRLAPFTAYGIGGPSDIWVAPRTEADIRFCVRLAGSHRIPLFVLGRGSNVLISDNGWRGITLYLGENFSGWTLGERTAAVLSGSLLNDLVTAAVNAGLAGIELLAGIPGGLGGALRMNAGAFGQEIASVVKRVHGIRTDGDPFSAEGRQIGFGYRRAAILDQVVITRAELRLEPQDPTILRRRVAEILEMRARKQPLQFPSCGSVFKRPTGYYAGALIEEAGLKGKRIGGAEVSRKHAGFILNVADARAGDVYRLIRHIEQEVKNRFGVCLEREVKLIGEFDNDL
jgi:UDP-N-acetylmuramate dehydrogenase